MAPNDNSSSGGIGFLGVLALIFITLKLMGFIDWSWWWVLAPLWGGFAFVLLVVVFAVAWTAVAKLLDDIAQKSKG